MSTDKTTPNPESAAPAPAAASEPKAPVQPATAAVKATPTAASTPLWVGLLLVIVLLACGGLGYYNWMSFQSAKQAQAQQQDLLQDLAVLRVEMSQSQRGLTQLQRATGEKQQASERAVAELQARADEQAKRLQTLSTTSRADWLLAEAEYLLRLAQQRLLMERSGSGAVALLQAADDILRDLDDSDLFAVREALQRDITALKLLPTVDREGLYLRLTALIAQSEALSQTPRWREEPAAHTVATVTDEPATLTSRMQASFWHALQSLGEQVRIRHNDEPLQPLLPPDSEHYLKQNLRFYLEQAQLALLREETAVFGSSLQEAEHLLQRYFTTEPLAQQLLQELASVRTQPIAVELPSIKGSLVALQTHIDRLHRLDPQAGKPQLPPDEAPATPSASTTEAP